MFGKFSCWGIDPALAMCNAATIQSAASVPEPLQGDGVTKYHDIEQATTGYDRLLVAPCAVLGKERELR